MLERLDSIASSRLNHGGRGRHHGFAYNAGNQLLTEDRPFASDTVTNTYINRLRLGLVPVPLSFTTTGGNLRLTWDTSAGFKLESATSLSAQNWTDVPGANSPCLAPLTGPAQFFRLPPAN